jgi:hypothetical protein
MELATTFPIPYVDRDFPLIWTNSAGQKSEVRAFGIPQFGGDAGPRSQPRVFYLKQSDPHQAIQFVLNLNAPTLPTQVMIAQIPRQATLNQTLRDMVQRCNSQRGDIGSRGMTLEDESTLAIPEMAWRIEHSFNDLAGTHITSGPLSSVKIEIARQDIDLRLERSGAEVKSESVVGGTFGGRGPKAPAYDVSGPFLLVLWQRGADSPFLVVWVENDELLNAFQAPGK